MTEHQRDYRLNLQVPPSSPSSSSSSRSTDFGDSEAALLLQAIRASVDSSDRSVIGHFHRESSPHSDRISSQVAYSEIESQYEGGSSSDTSFDNEYLIQPHSCRCSNDGHSPPWHDVDSSPMVEGQYGRDTPPFSHSYWDALIAHISEYHPLVTRVITTSSMLSSPLNPRDSHSSLPFLQPYEESVEIIKQSSEYPGCTLRIGELDLHMFYKPWSDKVVVENPNMLTALVVPCNFGGNVDGREEFFLRTRRTANLGPGFYKIWFAGQVVTVYILKRSYTVALTKPLAGADQDVLAENGQGILAGGGGSKHSLEEASDSSAKRRRLAESSGQAQCCPAPSRVVKNEGIEIGEENLLQTVLPGERLNIGIGVSGGYHIECIERVCDRVFKGRHSAHGVVAVKAIRDTGTMPCIPVLGREWVNEVRVLKQLNHHAIVEYRGADARMHAIYTAYHSCNDLAAMRCHEGSEFTGSVADAKVVLRDVSSGLAHMHAKKLYHFDIKPGNILYDPGWDHGRGRAILIDFGLAGEAGRPELKGAGTPFYVPPEFHDNRGGEGDMYALGIVMLYLLKEIPLPDVTIQGWGLGSRDMNAPESMANWHAWVKYKRQALGSKGIDGVVSKLLACIPSNRLTAEETNRRMESLLD